VTAHAVGPDEHLLPDPELVTTDARGKFQLTRLPRTPVRVGQHVDGLVVHLTPASRVTGRVVIEPEHASCPGAGFMLRDEALDRYVDVTHEADGTLHADGVIPGSYAVTAWCDGYLSAAHYPSLVVGDRDVGGLVWPVTRGATLRGRVVSQHGAPITDASVTANGVDNDSAKYAREQVTATGDYVLRGMRPGRYTVKVARPHTFGTVPAVESTTVVDIAGDTRRELTLVDTSGSITGYVAGSDGQALTRVFVQATPANPDAWSGRVRTDDAGAFGLENIPPGEYRLTVEGTELAMTIQVRAGYVTTAPIRAK